jgi:hypothetical protein
MLRHNQDHASHRAQLCGGRVRCRGSDDSSKTTQRGGRVRCRGSDDSSKTTQPLLELLAGTPRDRPESLRSACRREPKRASSKAIICRK